MSNPPTSQSGPVTVVIPPSINVPSQTTNANANTNTDAYPEPLPRNRPQRPPPPPSAVLLYMLRKYTLKFLPFYQIYIVFRASRINPLLFLIVMFSILGMLLLSLCVGMYVRHGVGLWGEGEEGLSREDREKRKAFREVMRWEAKGDAEDGQMRVLDRSFSEKDEKNVRGGTAVPARVTGRKVGGKGQ